MKKSIVLLIILFICSCSVNRSLKTSTPTSEILSLSYFEPIAFINYVEKGNKSVPSDSLSAITKHKLDSLMHKHKNRLRLSNELTFENEISKSIFNSETGRLAEAITRQRSLNGIKITPVIDSVMEKNNTRFAVSVVAVGFGRRKGNYGGQVAKGIGVGILTLGMVTPVPIRSSLNLYGFIFDSKKDEVTYYNRQIPNKEVSPTDSESMEKLLLELFNGYLYEQEIN